MPRFLFVTAALVLVLSGGLPLPNPLPGPASPKAASREEVWIELEPGLELGRFEATLKADWGDSRITVLRVDPRRWALRLLTAAAATGGERLSLPQWSGRFGLSAAVNAGMYQEDGLTSVGLLRSGPMVNNPRLNSFKALLAFDPVDESLPAVRIIDRECHDLQALLTGYGSLLQGIRMVSCRRENVWKRQAGAWSTAAVATDGAGRVLLLYTTSPYEVHDFIDILLALPLDLRGAMYLEGGPQAGLYLGAGGVELHLAGSYEHRAGVSGPPSPLVSPAIPNVLGVTRR